MSDKRLHRADESEIVANLIDEITNQLGRGIKPDIEAICRQYPAVEPRIRRLFPAMVAVSDLASHQEHRDDLPLPRTLGGFELVRQVGRGGMGVVYLARQPELDREVAIKVLPFAAVLEKRQLDRFRLEARAAALLKHPGIVSVHSVGVEHGIHYYVMEYVDGVSLAEVVAMRSNASSGSAGAFDWTADVSHERSQAGEANLRDDTNPVAVLSTQASRDREAFHRSVARLGVQVADALHYAHQRGVVHRDIKPSNLMLNQDGQVLITDFGLAQVQTGEDLTLTGDLVGTLRYMSPEQFSAGETVDARTDVYSLGLTLYELIAGRPAFKSTTRQQLMRHIVESDPPPLRKLDPRVPRDLETIIQKAIAKDPLERYRSGQDLADDLNAFLDLRSIRARRSTQFERLRRFAKRNPTIVGLFAASFVLITLLAGVSSLLAWNYSHQARAESVRVAEAAVTARRQRIGLYARDMRSAKHAADEASWVELQEILLRWAQFGEKDLRGFEWYHLWQHCENPAVVRTFGHELPVRQAVFLRNGRELAVSDFSDSIAIWPITANKAAKPRAFLNSPAMEIDCLLYRDATRQLISADKNGNITLWDPDSGKQVGGLKLVVDSAGLDDVSSIASTKDGRVLAIGTGTPEEGAVFLVDSVEQVVKKTIKLPAYGHAVFGPSDELVVSGEHLNQIHVYEPETWVLRDSIGVDASGSTEMAIAPDKSLVALGVHRESGLGTSSRIELWTTSDWTRVWSLGLSHPVRCAAFSNDGKSLACGEESGTVWVIDIAKVVSESTVSARRRLHAGRVYGVAFSPDGNQLATAGSDGFATVWDIEQLRHTEVGIAKMNHEFFWSAGGCFLDEGKTVATACRNVGAYVWDASSGRVLRELSVAPGQANLIVVTSAPDHHLACITLGHWPAQGLPGRVLIWDNAAMQMIGEIEVPMDLGNSVTSSTISPDGRFVVACSHKDGVVVIDVAANKILRVLDIPGKTVRFSRDSSMLACGTAGGLVHLVSFPDLQTEQTVRMDQRLVDCVDFSPDGRLVAAVGFDREVKVYDRATDTVTSFPDRMPAFPCLVRFSPDGKRILTGSLDGKIRLWITETGDQLFNWQFRVNSWPTGEFSRDGESIVLAGVAISHVIHARNVSQLRQLSISELRSKACQNSTSKRGS